MDGHQYNFSSNQLNSMHQCDDTIGQEQRSVNYQRIRSRAGSTITKEMRHPDREESIIKQEENMTTFLSDYQERSRKLTNEGIERKVGTSDSLDFQEGTQEKQQIKEEDEESEKSERINFRQEVSQFTNSSNLLDQNAAVPNRSDKHKVSNILASIEKDNHEDKLIILKSEQNSIDNQKVLEDNLQGISPINNRQGHQIINQDMPFHQQPTINLISLQRIENSQYQLNPITEQSEDQASIAKAINQFSDRKNSTKFNTPSLNPQPVQTAIFDQISISEVSQKVQESQGEKTNSPRQQFQSILSEMPRVMLYTVNKGQAISQPVTPPPLPQIPQVQPLSFQQIQLQQQIQQQQQQQNMFQMTPQNLINSQNYSTTKSQQKLQQQSDNYGSQQFYQIPQQILQPMTFNDFNQIQQSGSLNIFKNTSSAMQDKKIFGELEFSLNNMQMQNNNNNNIYYQQQQQQLQQQQTNSIFEKLISNLQNVIKSKDEQILKDCTLNDYGMKVLKLDELFKNVSQQYQQENLQLKEQFQSLQSELESLKKQRNSQQQNQPIDQLKKEIQDLKNELKEIEVQKRVIELKLKEDNEEKDQLKQSVTDLTQQLDKANQENKSYKISYVNDQIIKTLEKQNQELLQQISTLKAEQMCQEYIKSHQSYVASSTQMDSQQLLNNPIPKNYKNNNNLNNFVLNTQETSEENLTENSSSNQLNYIGNTNNQSNNRLARLQDKLLNHMRGQSQQHQNYHNIKSERSSGASMNLFNGKKNISHYMTPSRINQNNRSANLSVGRERNGEQYSIGNQQDNSKYDQNSAGNNQQNTPLQNKITSSGSSGGASSNQLSSYRLSQINRRNQQVNSDEKTVTFANHEIPQTNNEKLDANFTESIALDDIPNRKASEDFRYFVGQTHSSRMHYQAQGKLTDVNNSPVINPFTDNIQGPSSSRTKSFSQYQNYYDVPNGTDISKYKISPDKPQDQGARDKVSTLDSGKKEYFAQNRPKLNNIKGYLGESQAYIQDNPKSGRLVRHDPQQQTQSINLENQFYGSKLGQLKTSSNNYMYNNTSYDQLSSQLKNLNHCQTNLENEVNKLRGGREEENERKNMLNLELAIIKKEIAQIQAKMNLV